MLRVSSELDDSVIVLRETDRVGSLDIERVSVRVAVFVAVSVMVCDASGVALAANVTDSVALAVAVLLGDLDMLSSFDCDFVCDSSCVAVREADSDAVAVVVGVREAVSSPDNERVWVENWDRVFERVNGSPTLIVFVGVRMVRDAVASLETERERDSVTVDDTVTLLESVSSSDRVIEGILVELRDNVNDADNVGVCAERETVLDSVFSFDWLRVRVVDCDRTDADFSSVRDGDGRVTV